MAKQLCQGCDDPDAQEIFAISGFRLCHRCRTYGTDKQISSNIQTRHEQRQENRHVARQQEPGIFGDFKLILHGKPTLL